MQALSGASNESDRDKNIFLNTLHAIAMPDCEALMSRIPKRDRAWWYISNLRGFPQHKIVWIAKMRGDQPSVEAYFAGNHAECMKFTQVHHTVPEDACIAAQDLSGVTMDYGAPARDEDGARRELWAAWPMTNSTQRLIYVDQELPSGGVQLDPCQELVAISTPPLIIESRSGTGKTLVLLQHAAYYAKRDGDQRPALFVTVSRGLRDELERRYKEMSNIENEALPFTMFCSFRELLDRLLKYKAISDFEGSTLCTFQGYALARTTYQRMALEPHLIENEIGGVILGSLNAGTRARALSRDEYRVEKRSNVGNTTDSHLSIRELVYDEYERYKMWKTEQHRFDLGDVTLRLLREDWLQLFSSGTT
jgi:hypothetical protein